MNNIVRIYALTPMQEGFLFHSLMDKNSSAYFEQTSIELEGEINVMILEQSFHKLIEKYSALRTVIVYEGLNQPRQLVLNRKKGEVNYQDVSGKKSLEIEKDIKRYKEKDRVRGFEISKENLIRMSIIKKADQKYLVMLSSHHIIMDGWCTRIILTDLLKNYDLLKNDQNVITEERYKYENYIKWITKQDQKEVKEYWKNYLADYDTLASLPKQKTSDGEPSYHLTETTFTLNQALTTKFKKLAIFNQVTLNTLIQAVWAVLLHKYDHTDSVVFGSVVSGRPSELEGVEEMVGLFINTIPVKVDINPNTTFKELISSVHQTAISNEKYAYFPLVEIQSLTSLGNGLFNHIIAFENYPIEEEVLSEGDIRVNVHSLETFSQTNYDFNMIVMPGKEIRVKFDFNAAVYEKTTIASVQEQFLSIIRTVVEDDHIKIHDLDILSTKEREKILDEFNDTHVAYPKDQTVVQLFEEQIKQLPEHVAVVFEGEQLTYKELNERANALAYKLRKLGVGIDDYVAIMAERSLEMIIGILGIIKSGGAYVPIDPTYPKERMNDLLEDCQPKALLLGQEKMEIAIDAPTIELKKDYLFTGDDVNLEMINQPNDLAYLIYTSGTAGKPKGVMVEHQNVVSLVKNTNYVDFHQIVMGQAGSLSFDAATFEIWGALLNGGTVVMIKNETLLDSQKLKHCITEHQINTMWLTSAVFNQIIQEDVGVFNNLTALLIGGEKLSDKHVFKFKQHNTTTRLINGYGPTENTTFTTTYEIPHDFNHLSIGRAISNREVYILRDKQLSGIGMPGELCTSGEGVARGYLNDLALTKEKFINNPYGKGKLYRTGDLARWLPDGNIEYLGRMDDQVKIRGHRIELKEIESVLRKLEEVADAAAIVREDSKGERAIYVYFTSKDHLDVSVIQDEFRKALPDYMIPAYLTQIDVIPLTNNGKVDKKALPDIKAKRATYIAPRNEIEEALCLVFKDVLGIDAEIGIDDRFLNLGGDSIKAIRIVSKLREKKFQTDVRSIMQNKTPRKIGETVEKIKETSIDQKEVVGEVALTPIQKDFILHADEEMHHFNQSVMLERQAIDPCTLRKTLNELVRHHDMLRATYHDQRQTVKPYQENEGFDLSVYDYQEIVDEAHLMEEIEIASNDIQKSINLKKGPLFKVGLFQAKSKDYLLLCIHHLVVDGVSWRILIEDFATSYRLIATKKQVILPPKTSSFQAWSQALGRYRESERLKKELTYWKEVEQSVESGNIVANGSEGLGEMAFLSIELSKEQTAQLLYEAPQAYHAELNDLLLTSVVRGISNVTGQKMIAINMEGHGRETIHEEVIIDRTVGWFTSVYPVVIKGMSERMDHDICQVKETLRRVPHHGIGYGVLKSLGEHVLAGSTPTVTFNYLGEFASHQADEWLASSSFFKGSDVSEKNTFGTGISINSAINEGIFSMMISYNGTQYASNLMDHLQQEINKQLCAVLAHCLNTRFPQHTASDFGELVWSHEMFKSVLEKFTKQGYQLACILPLTGMQEGMLFHKLLSPTSSEYVVQAVYSIKGFILEEVLRQSFEILMKKHQALRISIVHKNVNEARQVILKERTPAFTWMDLSSGGTSEETLWDIYEQDVLRGFDLEEDSLMRITLIKLSQKDYRLMMSFHHIILDGWCISVIMNDFLLFYEQLSVGRSEAEIMNQIPKKKEYSDYIRYIGERDTEKDIFYWKNLLEGYEGKGFIPSLSLIDQKVKASVDVSERRLTREETIRLEALAQNYGVTINTIVEAAWGILLQYYHDEQDVVFGKVVSGRNVDLDGVEEMVGLFINTVPVRVISNDEITFGELIKQLQKQALRSGEHDHYALTKIQKLSGLGAQLVRTVLAFENYFVKESGKNRLNLHLERTREETNYDLSLVVYQANQLMLSLMYHTNKYGEVDISNILEKLTIVLKDVLENSEKKVKEIEIMTAAEKMIILSEFNDTHVAYPKDQTVVQLFEKQAKQLPKQVAVVFEDEQLTYQELNEKANALAYKLRKLGVGVDDYVAIMAERSLEMIIGILGIIKSGGAYVPIDPTYPRRRIHDLLEDCQPKALLLGQEKVEVTKGVPTIELKGDHTFSGNDTHLELVNKPSDLAYLIYTSGTTGKPKGVMVEHRNVLNLVEWQRVKGYCGETTVLQNFNYIFDGSVWEIFPALLSGCTLEIIPGEGRYDLKKVLTLLPGKQITMTPSMFKILMDHAEEQKLLDQLNGFKRLYLAGEALPYDLIKKYQKIPGNKIENVFNAYGPTEGTVCATIYKFDQNHHDQTLIGKPIGNTKVYIMKGDILCGIGVSGELCIAGDGVARGYLNRPVLTKEKFVDHPYGEGKLYRTGDLARWLPDGNIEYLGRIDEQVKIRGHRIELGEIESVLRKLEEIADAVAIAREDSKGEKAIYVYFTSKGKVDVGVIQDELRKALPDYMIPAYLTQIDVIPLTNNGKVDKKALPDIKAKSEATYIAPRNEIEEALCLVFKDVLETDAEIGIDDRFLNLGGDSIKAIRIVSKLREKKFQTDVRSIMQNKTPRKIGETVEKIKETSIDQKEVVGEVALTPIQKDFILHEDEEIHHFNQLVMLEPQARIDPCTLRKTLNELVRHHDMLRVTYHDQRQTVKPYQENEGFDLSVHDYQEIADEARLMEEIEIASNDIQKSINLETGPLFKVGLFQAKEKDYLLLCIHHLVVDGVSWRILIEDFATSYRLIATKKLVILPPKTSSFQAWSQVLGCYRESERLKKELPYWKEVEQSIEDGNIVANRNQGRSRMAFLSIELSEEQTSQLLYEAPQAYQAELNDLLLTSVVRGISNVTSQQTIAINIEGHGREVIDEEVTIDRTVGWFTSAYPVVIKGIKENIDHDIGQVKETLRRVPHHGIGYGALKSLGELEGITPTVTFNYLGEFVANEVDEWFTLCKISDRTSHISSTLCINIVVIQKKITIKCFYNGSKISAFLVQTIRDKIKYELENVLKMLESKNVEMDDIQKIISGDLSVINNPILGKIENKYQASTLQKYFLSKKEIAIISDQFHIKGNFEKEEVTEAVAQVILTHETLRSSYQKKNKKYMICEHARSKEATIPYLDMRYTSLSTRKKMDEMIDRIEIWKNHFAEGLCLSKFLILRESDDKYVVVFKVHHAIWDKMSSILLEEKVCSHLKRKKAKKPLPYSHYVTNFNKEIADECQKIKSQFLEGLKDYHEVIQNNSLVGSETSLIKLPENLYHMKEHPDIWDVLIDISSVIIEENGLIGAKKRVFPLQILQESRNKINIDYAQSLGAFLDLTPLLINLDDIKDRTSLSSHIHYLDLLKRKNHINWLELFGSSSQFDSVLRLNYLGLYSIDFTTVKKLLIGNFDDPTTEIIIALYGHFLIVQYPIFKKSSKQIGKVLQEKINKY